jgi:amidase
MSDLTWRGAADLARSIAAGELSAVDVTEAFLERIADRNPELNAIVTLDEEGARRRARQADEALARGEVPGPLHGVPVTIKDCFETAGLRTTAAHKPLAEHVPEQDAVLVARLREAGAVILGKTNLPELAMDIQTDNALFGSTRNPWDLGRTPGGSSGGECAALAAGMTPLGLGSDIGGSLRIPAHFCGVFALKTTHGLLPNRGHIPPMPGALDPIRHLAVAGPLARSVDDLRLGLRVLAGDALEQAPARPTGPPRIAWTDDFGGLPVTAATHRVLGELTDRLSAAGGRVERAGPPGFDIQEVWATYGRLFGAMAFVDQPAVVRAVLRLVGPVKWTDPISKAGFRSVRASLRDWFVILEQRDRLAAALERFLRGYDAWLCPVSSTPAFAHRKRGDIHTPIDVEGERLSGNLAGIGYTSPFNLTGHPVVVVPAGTSDEGLPIGVQLVGRSGGELALLDVAEQVARDFRRPPSRADSGPVREAGTTTVAVASPGRRGTRECRGRSTDQRAWGEAPS